MIRSLQLGPSRPNPVGHRCAGSIDECSSSQQGDAEIQSNKEATSAAKCCKVDILVLILSCLLLFRVVPEIHLNRLGSDSNPIPHFILYNFPCTDAELAING